eukprot:364542-Chlamydomonas_euryale.AAC.12
MCRGVAPSLCWPILSSFGRNFTPPETVGHTVSQTHRNGDKGMAPPLRSPILLVRPSQDLHTDVHTNVGTMLPGTCPAASS